MLCHGSKGVGLFLHHNKVSRVPVLVISFSLSSLTQHNVLRFIHDVECIGDLFLFNAQLYSTYYLLTTHQFMGICVFSSF